MEPWLFVARKLIAVAILPPVGPLLVLAAGLLLARIRPKAGFWMAWIASVGLLLLSVPWVAGALTVAMAGGSVPVAASDLRSAQAIVVLGGGLRPDALEYGTDAPNALSLERVRYAAKLARSTELPVLVTGGPNAHSRAEADIMGDVLEHEFGVPVRWREARARNTHENAIFSAEILEPEGVRRVLVVTHAVDARRARREFLAAGFDPISAPTVVPTSDLLLPWDLIPNMKALAASHLALYEFLGVTAMWIAGR